MEISKSSIFLYRVVKEQKSQRGERTKMGVTEIEREQNSRTRKYHDIQHGQQPH